MAQSIKRLQRHYTNYNNSITSCCLLLQPKLWLFSIYKYYILGSRQFCMRFNRFASSVYPHTNFSTRAWRNETLKGLSMSFGFLGLFKVQIYKWNKSWWKEIAFVSKWIYIKTMFACMLARCDQLHWQFSWWSLPYEISAKKTNEKGIEDFQRVRHALDWTASVK